MKIIINERKLIELVTSKIELLMNAQIEKVQEVNKDVDYSDLKITPKELDVIKEYINKPEEEGSKGEWPEEVKDKIPDLLNDSIEYFKRTNLAVMTVEEIAEFLTFTPEEIKGVAFDIPELNKIE